MTNRQWTHIVFEDDKNKNMKSLNHYFIKEFTRKLGFEYLFNWPINGNIVDNFEIILENGNRFSFFDDFTKKINLKDLEINRWSKIYYKHTKQSAETLINLNKNKQDLYIFNQRSEHEDFEGQELD